MINLISITLKFTAGFFKKNWISILLVSALSGAVIYLWYDYQGLREDKGRLEQVIRNYEDEKNSLVNDLNYANRQYTAAKQSYDEILKSIIRAEEEKKKLTEALREAEDALNEYFKNATGTEKECLVMPINKSILNGMPINSRNPNKSSGEESN